MKTLQVRRADPIAEQAEALSMWFGHGASDADLGEQEAAQLAEAKATIERIRKIQQLRAEVRRTKEAHDRAAAQLADLGG